MMESPHGLECSLYLRSRVDDTESFKQLLILSNQNNEIAKGYVAVLLLRTDLSQIMESFAVGDPLESAKIMIADILTWLEASAQENNMHAMYIRGICCFEGIHCERSGEAGLSWLMKAAELGHPSAQCRVGYAYNSGTDVEQNRELAFEYYMKSAEQGYAIAQSNVAVEYSTGTGAVEKNLPAAAGFYKLAADQGDKESQYCLGYAYATGKGVEENLAEAVKYYKLSADQNFVYAQYSLGFCFFYGKGVPQDTDLALKYLRLAANQGHEASKKFLDMFYESIQDEDGVKEGLGPVHQQASREESDQSGEELFALAEAYFHGQGHEKDIQQAAKLYRQAADKGHSEAQYKTAMLHSLGTGGVEVLPELAVQYYALAADQGNKAALYQLGQCYSNGIGVEVDKAEAVRYFRLAAEAESQGICVVS